MDEKDIKKEVVAETEVAAPKEEVAPATETETNFLVEEQRVRTLSYKKGNTSLSFSLNLSAPDDVKDFLFILEAAAEAVREEII